MKIVALKRLLKRLNRIAQPTNDPPVHLGQPVPILRPQLPLPTSTKLLNAPHRVPRRLPDLVEEQLVRVALLHVKVDKVVLHVGGTEREAERVRPTLGDSLGEHSALTGERLLQLAGRQDTLRVRELRFAVEVVEADAADDLVWFDDVSKAFGHLAAVLVADDAVEEDFRERELVGKLLSQHDHSGDPEEEDIVAGFHEVQRVEATLVGWPSEC